MEEKIIEVLSNQDRQSLTITEINDALNLETIEEYQRLKNTLEEMTTDGVIYYSDKKKKYFDFFFFFSRKCELDGLLCN